MTPGSPSSTPAAARVRVGLCRTGKACLVAALAAAAAAAAQGTKPPWGRQDPAAFALDEAYKAATSIPIAETCPRTLIDLSNRCVASDKEKSHQLLARVREWLESPACHPENGPHRRKDTGYTRDAAWQEQTTLLELAEAAYRLDPELARDCLVRATDWPEGRTAAGDFHGTLATAALKLMEGDREGAVRIVAAFCEAIPEKYHDRALETLAAFDPDAAVQFAGHFDPGPRAEACHKVAVAVSKTDLGQSARYQRLALEAALQIPRDEYPGWRIVCDSARGIAAADLDAAARVIQELNNVLTGHDPLSNGTRADGNRAWAGIQRPLEDFRDICSITERAVVEYHPDRIDDLEKEFGITPTGSGLASAAAYRARRGETKRALNLARSIDSAEWRATALAEIAHVVVAKDPERALSFYEEAFRLIVLDNLLAAGTLQSIARGITLIEPVEGRDCQLLIASAIAEQIRRRDRVQLWQGFSEAVTELAKLDPQAAVKVLGEMPSRRYGSGVESGTVSHKVLPYVAEAAPDLVAGALNEMGASESSAVAQAIVLRCSAESPAVAERFSVYFPADADFEAQVSIYRVAAQLLRDPADVGALLDDLPVQAPLKSVSLDSPVHQVIAWVAERDPDRAVVLCDSMEDPRTRDACLHYLACQVFTETKRVAEVARRIEDPSLRMATWLRIVELSAGNQSARDSQ